MYSPAGGTVHRPLPVLMQYRSDGRSVLSAVGSPKTVESHDNSGGVIFGKWKFHFSQIRRCIGEIMIALAVVIGRAIVVPVWSGIKLMCSMLDIDDRMGESLAGLILQ